ncbi:MAG TPA: hypothetical protein PLE74_00965 [Candidatus Cloacimonadota bacterium]|nr:hypothetical protein [Candidatus Cloacimonadota bacterium]
MNDRELVEEIRRIRESKRNLDDIKIPILVEFKGRAYTIDGIMIVPPVQVKQIYNEEGHRIVLSLNEESGK